MKVRVRADGEYSAVTLVITNIKTITKITSHFFDYYYKCRNTNLTCDKVLKI